MANNDNRYIVILASGTGTRFGGETPKQFVSIGGRTIIEHTLLACDNGLFNEIILVVAYEFIDRVSEMLRSGNYKTRIRIVAGGASRKESCKRGVAAINECEREARVVIHNGVQPFVSKDYFERCLNALEKYEAVTSGLPAIYTVLQVNENHEIVAIPDRRTLYCDMGVECFRLSLLRKLFSKYDDDVSTDIVGMVFRSGLAKVFVAEGESSNIKITHSEDLFFAEKLLKGKE